MKRPTHKAVARKVCTCLPLLVLGACAAGAPSATEAPIPDQWAAQIDLSNQQCEPINSAFRNAGQRFEKRVGEVPDGLLAEYVFSRYLPEGHATESVEVRSDPDAGLLTVRMSGDSIRAVRFEVACNGGWHVVRLARSDNYLGEGVTEEQFEQVSSFRQDREGRLVAGVTMKGEFTSAYLFASTAQAEGWYRFEPLD